MLTQRQEVKTHGTDLVHGEAVSREPVDDPPCRCRVEKPAKRKHDL